MIRSDWREIAVYKIILNINPDRIIKEATVPKNAPILTQLITYFESGASGNESPTTAIMNAMAVPTGIPLATKTWMTGIIPAALAYMGTARMTDNGTAYQYSLDS